MQVISPQFIQNKAVLLRYDIDVPLKDGRVVDDFRLKAGLDTLRMCLEHGRQIILMGHIGRPTGEDPKLSVSAIYNWLEQNGFSQDLSSGKLKLLENLRFEAGEERSDPEYAKQLAVLGEVFVNESFAAYHPSSSTTVLPTLLPSAAGLRFAKEVEMLTQIKDNPKRPLVAILGGAKVEDKLPVIEVMSKIADKVLVGGKLVQSAKFKVQSEKILFGELNQWGTDITDQTVENWKEVISDASQIVWNGPLGKVEDERNWNTRKIAEMIINSKIECLVGGGDTLGILDQWGLLDKFSFASTGGGAMLEFLAKGTLPTLEALG